VKPEIRRDPGRRAILVLATVYPMFAAIADGVKLSFYLVHVTPLYCMVVAIVAMEYLRAPETAKSGGVRTRRPATGPKAVTSSLVRLG
jgi:hypothetical protein